MVNYHILSELFAFIEFSKLASAISYSLAVLTLTLNDEVPYYVDMIITLI